MPCVLALYARGRRQVCAVQCRPQGLNGAGRWQGNNEYNAAIFFFIEIVGFNAAMHASNYYDRANNAWLTLYFFF
jgi:hypothetical protein